MNGAEKSTNHSVQFSKELWTKKKKFVKNCDIKKKLFKGQKQKGVRESENDEVTRLIGQRKTIDSSKINSFKDFPISRNTLEGLKGSEYSVPTEIQTEAITLAFRGLDILGAAKTGSGKTLAFVIPVLELLYTKLWTQMDGLGALVITPTRELAYQIFQTLRNVGRKHEFSAALVIGGKDLKFERKRMDQVNILICTPGRLLQHMDENPMFDCSNLQILVLDEADRCLDMGFEQSMNAIIANLPIERQTLLFSATQTKSVKDLARLSLKSPVYVSVHENSKFCTPETLQQSYMICPLESKLDMLWSFLKHHKRSKILVFLSSCKQVRFVHMLFCRMRPGISLLALYGSLHQLKRMSVYDEFCKKQAVVLFATDIASRGLDFPAVDWVVQLDCPEDATTYIHRVGRTARFNKDGEALLVLLPSEEEGALKELEKKKVPIEKIEVNPKKLLSVRRKFEALLARDSTIKDCAQRGFKSYLKFVFTMKNKEVFDVAKLDLESFARSLGLAVAPRVRFLQKRMGEQYRKSGPKNISNELDSDNAEEEDSKELKPNPTVVKFTKSAPSFDFSVEGEEDEDDNGLDDLFISKKPAEVEISDEEEVGDVVEHKPDKSKLKKVKTKAKMAKKLLKKNILVNKRVNFDDEGEAVTDKSKAKQSEVAKSYEQEDASGINIEKAKEILKLEDQFDKQMFRERIRQKHREARLKLKLQKKGLTKKDEDEITKVDVNIQQYDDGGEAESSDDYEPDLSWLPDPDKVYDNNEIKTEVTDSSDEHEAGTDLSMLQDPEVYNSNKEIKEEDVEGSSEETNKRRLKTKDKPKRKSKKRKMSESDHLGIEKDELDSKLMEELALKLLSK